MTSSLSFVRSPAPAWRRVWHGLHAPVPGVPRWARVAAVVVPLTVLPASLWRVVAITLHVPIVDTSTTGPDARGTLPTWMPLGVYVVLLSIASELLAFTAVGLVARWGEVVPRRIPGLGGRRVPTSAAVIPAALGATALTALWTWVAVSLALAAYAPLLAWGPLLGALTVAYARRRRSSVVPRG
ncbi:hypothetical protein KDY119_00755 [Luteimicrobium xylanilyticum]|uniref:Uncharacterized protein n=1 Tax=Luteimicrobium xylanilyticum TaxID=1133546 RepID=A0A5P9Q776_9MICO|nr:hypothetical protein [Luteimicrobium xylanilyticum]QFU97261.1 hypothetical protein KDY119_00755 [Luteimicrobium xylanilyticum]